MPQLYILLGARGSGRREVLYDLIRFGTSPEEQRVAVIMAEGEPEADSEKQLAVLQHVDIHRWQMADDVAQLPEIDENVTDIFVLVDGTKDPVDQLEALRDAYADDEEVEMARILTVLHSRLLFEKPALQPWFDACIHFSDVVLFNKREDVPNKWFKDFEQRFKKECYPCLFDLVKGDRVRNPAQILYPEPRRLTLAFDFDEFVQEDEGEDFDIVHDIVDEDDVALDAHEEDEEGDDDGIPEEPYFARDMTGRRVRQLPSISDYLGA